MYFAIYRDVHESNMYTLGTHGQTTGWVFPGQGALSSSTALYHYNGTHYGLRLNRRAPVRMRMTMRGTKHVRRVRGDIILG